MQKLRSDESFSANDEEVYYDRAYSLSVDVVNEGRSKNFEMCGQAPISRYNFRQRVLKETVALILKR